jgi:hypothetical protein
MLNAVIFCINDHCFSEMQEAVQHGTSHVPFQSKISADQNEASRRDAEGAEKKASFSRLLRASARATSFYALAPTSFSRSSMAALRERRTRPFSSTPRHLTQISSPILTMSSVCLTRKLASSLI